MTGNGRNLVLIKAVPVVAETVWVPIWEPPAWRDDELDRIPTNTELEAS